MQRPLLSRLLIRRPSARCVVACHVVGLCAIAGCDRSEGVAESRRGGSVVISAFADADILLPPLTVTGQGMQVVDAVFDRLAQPVNADAGTATYAPVLATTWTWATDSLSIDFHINPRARWHDGHPVTASDVRFTYLAYVDSAVGSSVASALHNIDSVQTRAALTARVWFKRRSAGQFADAVTQMRILPQHLLDSVPRANWRTSSFARHPIGSGRFRFANWQAGARLEVTADSNNYRGRPSLDRVVWTVAPDPSAATMRLFSGDADFLESVRPDAAVEFAKYPDVTLLKSASLTYGFLLFNLERAGTKSRPHPLFGDRQLRRALTLAIDRAFVVHAVFDSSARVALGPVARIQLGADTVLRSIAFDTTLASRVLDSLGWRATKLGAIRSRGGVPLQFNVLVPSSSSQRLRVAVLLQQLFRSVGVRMDIEKLEFNTVNARLATGDFDAAMMAIGADPQLSGIRGVWSSSASRANGGANFGSYANVRFDALLDSAESQQRELEARRYYREAYAQILADAPAIWLYEPWNMSGVHRALHPVGLRPDGWWMQLGEWTRDRGAPKSAVTNR